MNSAKKVESFFSPVDFPEIATKDQKSCPEVSEVLSSKNPFSSPISSIRPSGIKLPKETAQEKKGRELLAFERKRSTRPPWTSEEAWTKKRAKNEIVAERKEDPNEKFELSNVTLSPTTAQDAASDIEAWSSEEVAGELSDIDSEDAEFPLPAAGAVAVIEGFPSQRCGDVSRERWHWGAA